MPRISSATIFSLAFGPEDGRKMRFDEISISSGTEKKDNWKIALLLCSKSKSPSMLREAFRDLTL